MRETPVSKHRLTSVRQFCASLPCYNGGLSNTSAAEHNEAVAVTRRWFAGVLLRRGGCGTRADGHSEHSILRARGTLTLHQLRLRFRSSTTANVDPMLGGLVGCTSASAEPLHAAQKSAARLQLWRKWKFTPYARMRH